MPSILFAKTFFVLITQLSITFTVAFGLIKYFQNQLAAGNPNVSSKLRADGSHDLELNWAHYNSATTYLLFANLAAVIFMIFAGQTFALPAALLSFAVYSVTVGLLLGFCIISVDERDGLLAFWLTLFACMACAIVGLFFGIDFSFLRGVLFVALMAMLAIGIIRIFVKFSRTTSIIYASCGVILFSFYLIYDFNRLALAQQKGDETWATAINIAIGIYLDLINLFLYILELLSHRH